MWNLIKKYWDILGGTVVGLFLSLIANFKYDLIQLTSSVIILILVCIGVFRVIKISADEYFDVKRENGRKKTIVDKVSDSRTEMKAISIAQNPFKQGEELAEVTIETIKGGKISMKKIKQFFKWVWTYRQQLIGLLGAFVYASFVIYMYIQDKFGWIYQYFPQDATWQMSIKIIIAVLSVVFTYYIVRNQVKWCGVGSISKAQAYLEKVITTTSGKLSPTATQKVKDALKQFEKTKKETVKKLEELTLKYNDKVESIQDMRDLIKLGLGDSNELNSLTTEATSLENEIQEVKAQIENLSSQIEKYSQVLK